MSDHLKNLSSNTVITEDVIKASRNPTLVQIVNQALSGAVYIQNIGKVQGTIQVGFVLHKDADALLEAAYLNGDLLEVIDGEQIYTGYLTKISPSADYADGYHFCSVILQEEAL